MIYEVIILGLTEFGTTTALLDSPQNTYFEFGAIDEALAFAEVCWANGYETLVRKTLLGSQYRGGVLS